MNDAITGNVGDLQLVYGGTYSDGSYNRAKELAHELEPVTTVTLTKLVEECDTLQDIKWLFLTLEQKNINIVGSRGYVYGSAKLGAALSELEDSPVAFMFNSNVFPRTGGLRQKIIDIFEENDPYAQVFKDR